MELKLTIKIKNVINPSLTLIALDNLTNLTDKAGKLGILTQPKLAKFGFGWPFTWV